MKTTNYLVVNYAEPHPKRGREMLARYPELRKLFGNTPSTAAYVLGLVAFQIWLAILLSHYPVWLMLLASYTIGAIANHALWTLIHEATHNLILKSPAANKWMGIIANLPIVFPSAISFRIYHLKHHRHQGEPELDADLPVPGEAKLVGNSPIGKSLWLLFFAYFQCIRVRRLKDISFWDTFVGINIVVEVAFLIALVYFFGWMPFAYLLACSIFSVGLHPVGARWIQEHYVVHGMQETYSYYGPLNAVAFNVGYHNEHHDLINVPWSKLPIVRATAREYYDNLHSHSSWTGLLLKFIFDRNLSLYSRVIRPSATAKAAVPVRAETVMPGAEPLSLA